MAEFFSAVLTVPLLQMALAAGVLSGTACGIVGPFVVARRITYLAAGITHCILGGMGAAVYCSSVLGWSLKIGDWELICPYSGAVLAALLSAAIIGWVSIKMTQREDTVISALWSAGMATGVIFLAITPGYQQNLMGYLFGDILMVSPQSIKIIAGLDIMLLAIITLRYRQFLAVCFDEEFARTRGINTKFYYMLLLCMTALTVVVLVSVVGVIMVIALLTLPAATAGLFTRKLWHSAAIASALSVLLTIFGLALSYEADLPSGAVIILLAAGCYFVGIGLKKLVSSSCKTR